MQKYSILNRYTMIKLREVDKYIDSRFQRTFILKGVNLDVAQGEFLTIMGPSDAGKSSSEENARYGKRIVRVADGAVVEDNVVLERV